MTDGTYPGYWLDDESGFLTHDENRRPSPRHVPLTPETAARHGIPDDLLAIIAQQQETAR
jgi:hypothetical protein